MNNDKLVVQDLPSGGRSYPEGVTASVRGLYYPEAKSVSRYLDEEDLAQMVEVYRDVIGGIDVLDLELVDFSTLVILSSIYTVNEFKWNPKIRCLHRVDGEICGGDSIKSSITLADFDFTVPEAIKVNRVELNLKGWYYYPRRVRDELDRLRDKDDHQLAYATCIDNETRSATLEEKMEALEKAFVDDVREIHQIDEEMRIRVKPIPTQCSKCNNKVYIKMNMDRIRRCP